MPDAAELRSRIAESVQSAGGLEADIARDVAFHMTDWLAEFEELIRIYDRPHQFTPKQIYTAVLNFLVHAPEHVAEAALLMGGERVKYIFREPEQQAAEGVPDRERRT